MDENACNIFVLFTVRVCVVCMCSIHTLTNFMTQFARSEASGKHESFGFYVSFRKFEINSGNKKIELQLQSN